MCIADINTYIGWPKSRYTVYLLLAHLVFSEFVFVIVRIEVRDELNGTASRAAARDDNR